MSEQNEKLTAEEYFDRNFVVFKGEYFIDRNDFMNYAQQVEHATAEAKKETYAVYKEWKERFDDTSTQLVAEKAKTAELRHKLEQDGDKKEAIISDTKAALYETTKQLTELRKELRFEKEGHQITKDAYSLDAELLRSKIDSLKKQLVDVKAQRDAAVKSLKDETKELHDLLINAPVDFVGTGDPFYGEQEEGEFREAINLIMMREEATISRLSSGETKSEFKCVHGLPSEATCIDCLDDSHRPPPESLTDKK